MKEGVIFDIKRYAINDGPGIRTTVFLKGCPLNCWWCQNPEGINENIEFLNINVKNYSKSIPSEKIGYKIDIINLKNEILKDNIFYKESGGGVTFSGGEPLFQIEFLKSILIECKKNKIKTAIDTSGYSTIKKINSIYNYTDLFLYDLKFIDNRQHIKYTGKSNKKILSNLIYLTNRGEKVQIRIPLIPNVTDTHENLSSIKEFIDNLKNVRDISLLTYNKYAEYKNEKFKKNIKIKKLKTQTKKELNKIKNYFNSKRYKVNLIG
jgi:pyruvate formate lyase activating enzyme